MLIRKKILSTVFTGTLLALSLFPIASYAETAEKIPVLAEDTISTVETKSSTDTKPIVDVASLKLNKTSATLGDTIKVSLAADNSSNIDYIDINYIAPMSKNDKYITLKFNAKTNLFEGDIKIDEEFEDGNWVIRSIYATDLKGEGVYDKYFDSLPSGNFSVSGVRSELNTPKFDYASLEVTKKQLLKVIS